MSACSDLIAAVETATGKPGRRNGKNTRLICPAHDDHTPSLDIAEAADGSPLVLCRSCGAKLPEICAAIGRNTADYLPPRADEGEWTPHGPAVAVYRYQNADGTTAYEVCRTADKQFPVRRPDPTAKHGWRWNLRGAETILYRLPQVIAQAKTGGAIYICEGEKDVEALERAGAVATCNPGGAGKWRDRYAAPIRGATVIVIADNDEPGIAHARQVAASIAADGNGSAPTVRVMRALTGKDAADHLAAGHTLDQLEPLDWDPPPLIPFALPLHGFLARDLETPDVLLGTETDAIIPAGGLTVLAGMPGAGKTTLALDLAFHLASGTDWLNTPVPAPLRILLVENEGPEHRFQGKLRAKLTKWTAPDAASNIYVHTWRWGRLSLRDEDARAHLRSFIDDHGITLVIGDPLDTLGTTGVGSPEDTRDFVAALADLGLGTTVSYLFLHHFRKEVSVSEINQVSGAWGGRLDTLIVLKNTDKPDELRLSFAKLRWADERAPLIIGKIRDTASFQIVAEEEHTDSTKVEATFRRIIATLRATGPMERQRLAMNCETDINATFKRALRRAESEGLVTRAQEGRQAVYTLTQDAYL